LLPRPWEPATCRTPQQRQQLWCWLDAVVDWLVTEYVWDVRAMIPVCWAQHPHLVYEIAVLADQRRRAGHALTSDALEECRYNLPAFTERIKSRLRNDCEGRQTRRDRREAATPGIWPRSAAAPVRIAMRRDVGSVRLTEVEGRRRPRPGLVDLDTGEIKDL
jgi:hypothetical protein